MRRDEVEAAWSWVEPILAALGEPRPTRPKRYPAGTSRARPRPPCSLERDGRTWQEPDHDTPPSIPSSPTSPTASSSAAPPPAPPTSRAIRAAADHGPARGRLGCANLAHGFAASDGADKHALRGRTKPNVAIVTSYNDMLSAHQPFADYPAIAQAGRDPGRRHRPGRGRRAGDVRRHHPGPRRHAAVALQPRRDRDGHRDRAVATTCSTAR